MKSKFVEVIVDCAMVEIINMFASQCVKDECLVATFETCFPQHILPQGVYFTFISDFVEFVESAKRFVSVEDGNVLILHCNQGRKEMKRMVNYLKDNIGEASLIVVYKEE